MPGTPARIAVIGRHTWSTYFASYSPIVVSDSARSITANAHVVSARLRSPTSCWATWFHVFQTGEALQNLPATVWSAVRVVLASRPRLATSVSADAYAAPSTAGCAAGRNWLLLLSKTGATETQFGN